MIEKLSRIFFFLLVLLIPIQLGKHFWPSFAFVSGIRVDYLSPILYLSDVITLFVIVLFVYKKSFVRFKPNLFLILFILVLLIQFFIARSPLAHLYGVTKLLEMVLLGIVIAVQTNRQNFHRIIYALNIGAFFSSLLAFAQMLLQHSVGGIFYFFGERTFSVSTIGIAKMNSYNAQILRPYGAFPHPNVLAFFLLASIILTIYYVSFEKNRTAKILLVINLLVSTTGFLLTFSRVTILCLIAFLIYYVVFKAKRLRPKHFLFQGTVAAVITFFLILFSKRFFSLDTDFLYRLDLTKIAFSILQKNFLLGVGLNNFFIHEIVYQKAIVPTLLQPVHNIYLLVLVQLGFLGSLFPIVFVWKTFKRVWTKYKKEKNHQTKSVYESLGILLIAALSIGLFDHFLFTLQQGQLMAALVLGLCWANFKRTKTTV